MIQALEWHGNCFRVRLQRDLEDLLRRAPSDEEQSRKRTEHPIRIPRSRACEGHKNLTEQTVRHHNIGHPMAFYDEKDWREMFRLRRAIVRAEQSLSEIDREILPHGLCESDVAILERLARKGARPVNGLARQVGLTSGSMTSAVKRLHRRGLVETKRDLDDKRVVWVSVTEEAKEIVQQFSQLRGEALETVFQKWAERERSVLINLLRRVRTDAESNERVTA